MAEDDWDNEDGMPGVGLLANAIQVWSVLQRRDAVFVKEAAEAFKIAPSAVVTAVDWHAWMFLSGPDDDYSRLMIEHEGE